MLKNVSYTVLSFFLAVVFTSFTFRIYVELVVVISVGVYV